MIKRLLLGVIVGVSVIFGCRGGEVPRVIHNYYSAMVSLSTVDLNKAIDLENIMKDCFFKGDTNRETGFSGIVVVDLFVQIRDRVASNTLTKRLRENINLGQNFKVNKYQPLSCKSYTQPDMNKKGNEFLYNVEVYVEVSDRSKNHTEYVTVRNDKITKISDSEWADDVNSLMVKAAKFYTEKKYKEAYDTYNRIISADPHNANAYYRLGVMTLRGQGAKRNISTAKSLFEKIRWLDYEKSNAANSGFWDFYEIKEKAEFAIYYIDHPQSI